ncbi:MAG: alanine--glyoxylate aminotransferase family protein [Firmicutes bacterium]|nr:alanine--glyoxylate aminotransferase family protein [Bacillota bacterium]
MAKDKEYLFIPGPTPVPPQVMTAMTKPIIGHRSGEFSRLYRDLVKKMQKVYQTENDLFILSNSGTGAMEMALANTVNPGEKVLSLVTGHFAQRFNRIATVLGADVDTLDFPWGGPVDLDMVENKLRQENYRAVLVTHNETSTGVINDLAALGQLTAQTDALLLVDAVSSLGGADIKTDEYQLDLVVTSSQKALMLPPGLAAISVSSKAWERVEKCKARTVYFSLADYRQLIAKGHTPWTPAVGLLYGLEAALDMILAEGLEEVFRRHQRLAQAVRAGMRALGLKVVAPEECASPTVTAVWAPEGVNPDELRRFLREELGVYMSGGKGSLAGKVFRFGHMGYVGEFDIITGLAAVEMGLAKLGRGVQLGAGVAAAQELLLHTLGKGGRKG